jgi:hypothetical protein
MTSARVAIRIDTALEPVLGPDRLVASAQLVSGPHPYAVLAGTAVLTGPIIIITSPGLITRGWLHASHPPALWLIALLAAVPSVVHPVLTLATQRPMFFGVGGQRLVYARLSTFRRRLTTTVVVPASGAQITQYRKRRLATTVQLDVPGTSQLRLHAVRKKEPDLHRVLVAAQAAGMPMTAAAFQPLPDAESGEQAARPRVGQLDTGILRREDRR